MEKYIAYDADWQTPARTEQYVYECLKATGTRLDGSVYVAFPWANLIDGLARDTDLGHRLLAEYEKIVVQLKYIYAKRVVSVCQHIKFQDYAYLFKRAGITDLFVSHKEKNQTNLGAINLYALQLFPVQSTAEVRADLAIQENKSTWIERKYPYSFVGAYDGRYYLTDSRKNIFDHLKDKGGLVTERMSWHYQARVYDQQVYGKELSEEYLSEEQKNALEYIDVLQSSKFSLCPSGTGPNSIRLWESIEYGSIPIILADTLDLPGDKTLWEDACLFVEESSESIKNIPALIQSIIDDENLYNKKVEALELLRSSLGLESFAEHIIQTIREQFSKQFFGNNIFLDCSGLQAQEVENWLKFLSALEHFTAKSFKIHLSGLKQKIANQDSYSNVIDTYAPDFSKDFVVLFDSKTISNALLSKFNTIIIRPVSSPITINQSLFPLVRPVLNELQTVSWKPTCTLITSMFNGDEYKQDFLENVSEFKDLEGIEVMVFRPESRGKEHFDLLNFGVNNTSLVYVWLAHDPGLYDVWNLGARLASSNFLSNANIDDKRGPNHIKATVNALNENQQCDVGSTALRVTDTKNLKWADSDNEVVWYKPNTSEVYSVEKIVKYNEGLKIVQAHNIPHCMPIWRAKLHRQYGYFEEKRFGPSSDWEFWLRCGIQGSKFYLLNEDHGLYYRAPQSYWRRDPNAKNYDLIIANEHFDDSSPRSTSLSRTVKSFNLDRLLKTFAEADYYSGLSQLLSYLSDQSSGRTPTELRLLAKVCELYLNVKLESVEEALSRLKPVSGVKDTFIDSIGFCLRAIGYLSEGAFSNYMLLADKIAINESELVGWIVKAKLYSLKNESLLESDCLAIAYKLDAYAFWCNVNRIYGLEKVLGYFIQALSEHTNVPPMSNFSWLEPGKKLFFFPDYTHGNPYQTLLYQNISNANVTPVGLSEQESIALDIDIFEKGDVLHIHWINVLFKGHTKETIQTVLDEFIDKIEKLKSNGVKIVWTVHNRQNHETIDLDVELAFRRKLSCLCDAVLLHHPMIAIELSNWLDSESNIEIIEHGLYSNYYPNSISKDEARLNLGLSKNGTVISTLGQVREYKNLPDKVDAISSVNQSLAENIQYLIAGKISCIKTLEKLKDNSEVLVENRFIKDEEVQVFLNASDFILLSYRDILTSGSFFQAVTFNKPVLSPALGSLQYYVCDGVNGYLYSDSHKFADYLQRISADDLDSKVNCSKIQFRDWPQYN
ncbi:exostosin [Alteromonas mediterranea MED64]|uniref:exostosin domain-containing protein n=1 Tax=Alteromonas mediterranea TaxID=314275 RepID=UPI0003557D00|nr:exostosin family protein [Alteromonas mediterranea]AGP83271.1 exostosin [Alteromonas mediterranea MED64]